MPILKAEADRVALVDCVTSGSKKFFLGTDSAPHDVVGRRRNRTAPSRCRGFGRAGSRPFGTRTDV